MEMCHADMADAARRDAGQRELALSPLAGIEQKTFAIPPEEIGIMAPFACRGLAARSKSDKLPCAHACSFQTLRAGEIMPFFRASGTEDLKERGFLPPPAKRPPALRNFLAFDILLLRLLLL
jgi:hypothetical protein